MKPMHLIWPAVIAVGFDCSVATGAGQPPSRGSSPNPSAVETWLDCVECTSAQLAAVATLGDAAVPELNAILRSGPPQAKVDSRRAFLQTRWQRMRAYAAARGEPLAESQTEYVDGYLQRFVLLNRARAARGLGAINTPAARTALQQTLQMANLPDALRREINVALGIPNP